MIHREPVLLVIILLTVISIARGSSTCQLKKCNKQRITMQTNLFDKFTSILPKKESASISNTIKSVAITGSSGLVGSTLASVLKKNNNVKVIEITTNPAKVAKNGNQVINWNPQEGSIDDISQLEGVDVFIHLAGENVASGDAKSQSFFAALGRWNTIKKQKIVESRVQSTRLIINTMKQLKKKPKLFICASGIGYYGFDDFDTVFDDSNGSKGNGFLSEVCQVWEEEALKASSGSNTNIKTVLLRFAPILSMKAGLIKKLYPIFNLGAAGILGNGKQPFSYVTLRDVVRVVEFLLFDKKSTTVKGPVNVVSNSYISNTNQEFTNAFAKALGRPAIFPVPKPVVDTVFGEMGQEMLLGGQKAKSSKLSSAGFQFIDNNIDEALRYVVQNKDGY